MDRYRLPNLIVKYQASGKKKPRTNPQKISLLLMGPKRIPGLKPCRVDKDNDDFNLFLKRDYFKRINCKHGRLLNSRR
jgi:hypothetical protein